MAFSMGNSATAIKNKKSPDGDDNVVRGVFGTQAAPQQAVNGIKARADALSNIRKFETLAHCPLKTKTIAHAIVQFVDHCGRLPDVIKTTEIQKLLTALESTGFKPYTYQASAEFHEAPADPNPTRHRLNQTAVTIGLAMDQLARNNKIGDNIKHVLDDIAADGIRYATRERCGPGGGH